MTTYISCTNYSYNSTCHDFIWLIMMVVVVLVVVLNMNKMRAGVQTAHKLMYDGY